MILLTCCLLCCVIDIRKIRLYGVFHLEDHLFWSCWMKECLSCSICLMNFFCLFGLREDWLFWDLLSCLLDSMFCWICWGSCFWVDEYPSFSFLWGMIFFNWLVLYTWDHFYFWPWGNVNWDDTIQFNEVWSNRST